MDEQKLRNLTDKLGKAITKVFAKFEVPDGYQILIDSEVRASGLDIIVRFGRLGFRNFGSECTAQQAHIHFGNNSTIAQSR